MATNFLSIEDEELDLTCPICFEDYQLLDIAKQPKVLLCLHTFCYSCLETILSCDVTLQCSFCRAEHGIISISDLMDNNVIFEHLRMKQELADRDYALRVALGDDTSSSESEEEDEDDDDDDDDDDDETGSVIEVEGFSENMRAQLQELLGMLSGTFSTQSGRQNEEQQLEEEQHQQQGQLQESERQPLEQPRSRQQLEQPHRPQQQDTASALAIRPTTINDRKVFVGGISLNTTTNQLITHFSRFGAIEEINLKCGFAFIVFAHPRTVSRSLGWHEINGKEFEVKKYIPKHFKIFVGNIIGMAEEEVKAYCSMFGPIKNFFQPSQDFCFVSYEQESEMFNAIRNPLPVVFGHRIRVNRYNPSKWYNNC